MEHKGITSSLACVLTWPTVFWVLTGFLFGYFLFFISPVFLNSQQTYQFFRDVPAQDTIGGDFKVMRSTVVSWLVEKPTPYIGRQNLYPPLTTIFFTALLPLDVSTSFKVITVSSFLCYLFASLLIPAKVGKTNDGFGLLVLLFATGLFSYGFQFELERGQFNVIAFLCCLVAIYLFHYQQKYRYLAYALFSVSIQLKVYPAIFVVMFVRDWADWKGNLKRFLAIGMLNLSLLFVLGDRAFVDFITTVQGQVLHPAAATYNHSIQSFVTLLTLKLSGKLPSDASTWIVKYPREVDIVILAFVLFCIVLVILKAYRERFGGLNSYLLLVCTIGALLIPSNSHDYKLSILAGPMAIALRDIPFTKNSRVRFLSTSLVFVLSLAYSSTLYSFTNKPWFLQNNFPALMLILISFTVLALIPSTRVASDLTSEGNQDV